MHAISIVAGWLKRMSFWVDLYWVCDQCATCKIIILICTYATSSYVQKIIRFFDRLFKIQSATDQPLLIGRGAAHHLHHHHILVKPSA